MNEIEEGMEIEEEEPMKYIFRCKVNQYTNRFSGGRDWESDDSWPFEETIDGLEEAMEYFEQAKKIAKAEDPVTVLVCVNPLYETDLDTHSISYPEISLRDEDGEEIDYYNVLEEEFPEILEAWRGGGSFLENLQDALNGDLSDREGLEIYTFERDGLYELYERKGWI